MQQPLIFSITGAVVVVVAVLAHVVDVVTTTSNFEEKFLNSFFE